MKLQIFAAIATFANAAPALRICEPGNFHPKCTPEDLLGDWEPRYETEAQQRTFTNRRGKEVTRTVNVRVGSDIADYDLMEADCRPVARKFDAYCHQYGVRETVDRTTVTPKYADFRLDDGTCNHAEHLNELACLSQQCMFEYCLWRRDEWIDDCEAAVDAGTDIPARPGWGQVYNYGNMYNDLRAANSFESDTCLDYYVVLEDY